jgi:hypothetical protein
VRGVAGVVLHPQRAHAQRRGQPVRLDQTPSDLDLVRLPLTIDAGSPPPEKLRL